MISTITWSEQLQDYLITTIDGKRFKLSDLNISDISDFIRKFAIVREKVIVRSRDRISTETPSKYTFRLPQGYFKKNIVDMKLVSCNVPNTVYNVTSRNNSFKIGFGSSPSSYTTITLPLRNYSIDELCIMIEGLLKDEGVTGFSMKPVTSLLKIKMTYSEDFKVDFTVSNPCNTLLGFSEKLHSSSSSSLISENVYDVGGVKLFKIHVSQMSHVFPDGIQTVLRDPYAENVIYENYDYEMDVNFARIQRLSSLNIEIRGEDNELVELNGSDNVLVFEIAYLDIVD